jgi:glutamate decarboxylase
MPPAVVLSPRSFTLNFSRPGNQIVGQYYNFARLGFEGYHSIMGSLQWGVQQLAKQIGEIGPFEVISDGSAIPVIAFALKDPKDYTVYDISTRLRHQGWQVPAYPLPKNAEDKHILRIVGRLGMSLDMTDTLVSNIKEAIAYLDRKGGDGETHAGFSH